MEHEPRSLLRHTKRAVKFRRRDAVLAVQEHPDCREPLLQGDRRVLKDRASLQREARFRVLRIALPDAILGKVADLFRTAFRALYLAIRPAQIHHELAAGFEFREVQDRVSEASMYAQELSMRSKAGYVKYILSKV